MRCVGYEQAKHLSRAAFRRRTGVTPETFAEMLNVLRLREAGKRKSGRPPALTLEDQLLMTLEFWREYRTYFHLGQTWGLHETTVQRTVVRIEDALMQSGRFTLPGRPVLRDDTTVFGVVVVDATEMPCERPKGGNAAGTAARRSVTP